MKCPNTTEAVCTLSPVVVDVDVLSIINVLHQELSAQLVELGQLAVLVDLGQDIRQLSLTPWPSGSRPGRQ